MTTKCFIYRDLPCNQSCMAFDDGYEGESRCQLLTALEGVTEALLALSRRRPEFKHPAPPDLGGRG